MTACVFSQPPIIRPTSSICSASTPYVWLRTNRSPCAKRIKCRVTTTVRFASSKWVRLSRL